MVIPTNANGNADIDKEWATSLVGLRMKVSGSWWTNSTGNTSSSGIILHPGKIHSVDFQAHRNRFFLLQLDDVDEPELYPMRYDAVLAYADECSELYDSFRLPSELVPNPVNEIATQNCTEYTQTDPISWTVLKDGENG